MAHGGLKGPHIPFNKSRLTGSVEPVGLFWPYKGLFLAAAPKGGTITPFALQPEGWAQPSPLFPFPFVFLFRTSGPSYAFASPSFCRFFVHRRFSPLNDTLFYSKTGGIHQPEKGILPASVARPLEFLSPPLLSLQPVNQPVRPCYPLSATFSYLPFAPLYPVS